MVKLFEEYKIEEELFDKVRSFFEEISKKDHYVRKGEFINGEKFITIRGVIDQDDYLNSGSKSLIWFLKDFTIIDNFDNGEGKSPIKNKHYPSLVNYLYTVLSPYIKYHQVSRGRYNTIESNLTRDTINQIKFSKKDYEEFEDTERFGL